MTGLQSALAWTEANDQMRKSACAVNFVQWRILHQSATCFSHSEGEKMQAREDAAANVYKICLRRTWQDARRHGYFAGSADDRRDGYIHLSTAQQLHGILGKHFAGQTDLVLIGIDADRLGAALRWQRSRGGTPCPHLYGLIDMAAVVSEAVLILNADGRHRLPEDLWLC